MKRKWRKVSAPGWLAGVAKQVGLQLEAEVPEPIKKYTFNNVVKASDPLHQGMVVDHWLVGMVALQGTVRPKRVHICISRCGVVAGYQKWEIEGGRLPQTCYGCRPGEHAPPPSRVLPEIQLKSLSLHWSGNYMATAFEEKSTLASKEGTEAWMNSGREVMQEIVNRTRFGHAFGWKVYVRGITKAATLPKRHRVKIEAVFKGEKRFEMTVQPARCPAVFRVDLATGRSDVPFGQVAEEVERAVSILRSLDEGDVEAEPVAAAVTAAVNGHVAGVGPVDLAKLVKIKAGIENLLTVGKDVNELAALKDAARKRVEAAVAKKGDIEVKKVEAEEAAKSATVRLRAANELADRAAMHLRNAIATRDNLQQDVLALEEKVKAVGAEWGPAVEDARAAEKELADLEALEADRLKSVGDAKGLAVLLEALGKIG